AISARAEHHVVVLILTGRDPRVPIGPEAPVRRDRHARDALKGAIGRRVLGFRRPYVLWGSEQGGVSSASGRRDGDESRQGQRDDQEPSFHRGAGADSIRCVGSILNQQRKATT